MATYSYDLQRMFRWALLKAMREHREDEEFFIKDAFSALRRAWDSISNEEIFEENEEPPEIPF